MKFTTKIANLKTEFSVRNTTNIAGIKVMLAYLEKIGLDRAFHTLGFSKATNALFPTYRILLYFIVGWMLGCERLFHFKQLQDDALIRRFLGGRCPHHSLLYKELARLGQSGSAFNSPLKKLNIDIIAPALPASSILDFDSTVETLYGNQQGAAIDVNSHKRGRKSYHPLLVYEGQSRLLINAELRPGNTSRMFSPLQKKRWICCLPIRFAMPVSTRALAGKTFITSGNPVRSVMLGN